MRDTPPNSSPKIDPPTLTIDWDAYLPFFEDAQISEDEKRELIETLWSIVLSFVDLGFGIHPVQQACGKNDDAKGDACSDLLSSIINEHSAKEDPWKDQ